MIELEDEQEKEQIRLENQIGYLKLLKNDDLFRRKTLKVLKKEGNYLVKNFSKFISEKLKLEDYQRQEENKKTQSVHLIYLNYYINSLLYKISANQEKELTEEGKKIFSSFSREKNKEVMKRFHFLLEKTEQKEEYVVDVNSLCETLEAEILKIEDPLKEELIDHQLIHEETPEIEMGWWSKEFQQKWNDLIYFSCWNEIDLENGISSFLENEWNNLKKENLEKKYLFLNWMEIELSFFLSYSEYCFINSNRVNFVFLFLFGSKERFSSVSFRARFCQVLIKFLNSCSEIFFQELENFCVIKEEWEIFFEMVRQEKSSKKELEEKAFEIKADLSKIINSYSEIIDSQNEAIKLQIVSIKNDIKKTAEMQNAIFSKKNLKEYASSFFSSLIISLISSIVLLGCWFLILKIFFSKKRDRKNSKKTI